MNADAVMDKPLSFAAFEVLYWTGIREGELLALTPGDFNTENNQLSIDESAASASIASILLIRPPKRSISATDSIPIPAPRSRQPIDSWVSLKKLAASAAVSGGVRCCEKASRCTSLVALIVHIRCVAACASAVIVLSFIESYQPNYSKCHIILASGISFEEPV